MEMEITGHPENSTGSQIVELVPSNTSRTTRSQLTQTIHLYH